jgi:hypothetical protein
MASEKEALNVKHQYAETLRQRYSAHTIMVTRDPDGDYFLKVLVALESTEKLEPQIIEGVSVCFERSERPKIL